MTFRNGVAGRPAILNRATIFIDSDQSVRPAMVTPSDSRPAFRFRSLMWRTAVKSQPVPPGNDVTPGGSISGPFPVRTWLGTSHPSHSIH